MVVADPFEVASVALDPRIEDGEKRRDWPKRHRMSPKQCAVEAISSRERELAEEEERRGAGTLEGDDVDALRVVRVSIGLERRRQHLSS